MPDHAAALPKAPLKAPGQRPEAPLKAPGQNKAGRQRFAVRLVAGMLLVSLPIMSAIAVLLTTKSSASLTASSEAKGISVAFDIQGVGNPAFNRDRGPVAIAAVRLHLEY